MPQFRFHAENLAVGGTNANVMAGSAFEFLRAPARVTVRATTDGVTTTPPTALVQFGSEVQFETGPIPVERSARQGPTADDRPLADDVADAGDRLVVRVTNADSVVREIDVVVEITYLA